MKLEHKGWGCEEDCDSNCLWVPNEILQHETIEATCLSKYVFLRSFLSFLIPNKQKCFRLHLFISVIDHKINIIKAFLSTFSEWASYFSNPAVVGIINLHWSESLLLCRSQCWYKEWEWLCNKLIPGGLSYSHFQAGWDDVQRHAVIKFSMTPHISQWKKMNVHLIVEALVKKHCPGGHVL